MKNKIILSVALIAFSYCINAQKYPFRNFTVAKGLNSNSALCAFQNDDQKLWIGTTHGINIYDGIKILDARELFDFSNHVVYSINKYDGKIHIGTNDGLFVYAGDSLKSYRSTEDGILDFVYNTFKDKNGTIWVATEKGVKVFKEEQLVDTLVNSPLHLISIYNINQDSDGTLWFCSKMNGLFKYRNNKIEAFQLYEPNESEVHFVAKITQINDSTHWVCARKGLFEISKNSSRKIDSIGNKNIQDVGFFDLLKTRNGELILSGNDGNIYFIQKNQKTIKLSAKNGLSGGVIIKMLEDKEGTLWFLSTQDGVSQLIQKKMSLYDKSDMGFKGVDAFVKKNDSVYYLISEKQGVLKYNTFKNTFDTIKINKADYNPDIIYNSGIFSASKNLLLVGTNEGIFTYKNEKLAPQHFIKRPHGTFKIHDLAEDNKGIIWLATSHGIHYVKNNKIEKLNDKRNINLDYVSCVKIAKNGTIYFGTNQGLFLWNGKRIINYSKKIGLKIGLVRQIQELDNGALWVAANQGLFKIIKNEFIKHELPGYSKEIIHSFEFDNKKNLWIGLSNGILRVNQKKEIRFFSKKSGFMGGSCKTNAILKTKENQLFVGTNEGLLVINTNDQYEPKSKCFPTLDINVLGVNNLSEYIEKEEGGRIKHLSLPNGHNNFKISYRGVHLLAGKELKFTYQLEGENEKVKIEENDFEINYSQVSFGDYIVKIKPLPHPNLLEEEEYSVLITIRRPFYLQWWFVLICVTILITWGYSYFIITKNVKLLNEQKSIILNQKGIVEEKNREIVDSITYAKRIQEALLPNSIITNQYFKESFILYKPRDIVSGDFYLVEEIEDSIVFAAADCTGHGVPGAMVSLMCSNLLRKVIVEERIINPGEALDRVASLLLERLKSKDNFVNDGMDISLCIWNKLTNELKFSGANNPLYLIRNGKLNITKPNKQPIGYFRDKTPFTTHVINLLEGDQIVLFSDGYKDQFGGVKGKKLGINRFKKSLLNHHSKTLQDQKENLESELNEWMIKEDQVDDICIFSVKV
jgi:ligand-binding sensor domain-containing protein/serine phosphatase RsbU (regulator of sigma subunit)